MQRGMAFPTSKAEDPLAVVFQVAMQEWNPL